MRESLEHRAVFPGLAEVLINVSHVRRINRLHADEHPLAARLSNQINQFLIAQQVSADLRDPGELRLGLDDVSQERLRAFDIDREIVVNEEDGNLAALFARSCFESQEFVNHAFIGAEANRIAEESGDSAKLAAVGTTAPGLERHDMKRSPAGAQAGQHGTEHFRHQTELV